MYHIRPCFSDPLERNSLKILWEKGENAVKQLLSLSHNVFNHMKDKLRNSTHVNVGDRTVSKLSSSHSEVHTPYPVVWKTACNIPVPLNVNDTFHVTPTLLIKLSKKLAESVDLVQNALINTVRYKDSTN